MVCRLLLFLFVAFSSVSCDRQVGIDRDAALKWSKRAITQARVDAATHGVQRDDGTWVFITTARMTNTEKGLLYEQGEILKSGFLVYPDGEFCSTIDEAIQLANQSKGAIYPNKD